MALHRTQPQSTYEQREAQKLSLEPTQPPAAVPGYKLIKFLGSGGYGEVWSAHDLKTGRKVAIKFFLRGSASDISLLAGEVEKLALLGADRYVVQLLDVGWDAQPPYYVMDYIEHGSLEDRLGSGQVLPTGEATELFRELATGMMHMHNKGILHCDLKPGNVMLDQEGKPRIADFGQSRLSTGDSPSLGTLFYMAPEQADLKAIPDARWDVYALGAIFFSMLTGKPPYYSDELTHQIEKSNDIDGRLDRYREALLSAKPPAEHRSVPGVDRALAEIIDGCIAAHPNDRFENIASILIGLQQREIAIARKPLMILGLVGPSLLITLMSIFGWLAFSESVRQTKNEITRKAIEANRFAAQLAARSAAEQINDYFRAVTQLARDENLLAAFDAVHADQELQALLKRISDPTSNALDYEDPNVGDVSVYQAREAFRRHPTQALLQPFLNHRLFDASGEFPVAASWFICDRYGNQIASAFRDENQTLGKNYSYRSYFTGLNHELKFSEIVSRADLDTPDAEPKERTILQKPHLSAAFKSEQSNTWKVAFSAPIYRAGGIEGLVAVTVDLGNFIDFVNQENHYAMLVDARPGDNHGIILEHPLFQSILMEEDRLPEALGRCIVDLSNISETSSFDEKARFVDPVGKTEVGKMYNQESIFGVADVTLLKSYGNEAEIAPQDRYRSQALAAREPTGLVVIAAEDYASVVKPAERLIYQWGKLASFAFLFLLTASIGMWFFVRRLLQASRKRLELAFSPSVTESNSFRYRETIQAVDREGATEG